MYKTDIFVNFQTTELCNLVYFWLFFEQGSLLKCVTKVRGNLKKKMYSDYRDI